MYWNFRYLQGRESWLTDGPMIERFAPPLGPGVAERFAWSRDVTDAQVNTARAFRIAFRKKLAALLGDDGVLLMPTMPDIAPLRSAVKHARGLPQRLDPHAVRGRAQRLPAAVDAAGPARRCTAGHFAARPGGTATAASCGWPRAASAEVRVRPRAARASGARQR